MRDYVAEVRKALSTPGGSWPPPPDPQLPLLDSAQDTDLEPEPIVETDYMDCVWPGSPRKDQRVHLDCSGSCEHAATCPVSLDCVWGRG